MRGMEYGMLLIYWVENGRGQRAEGRGQKAEGRRRKVGEMREMKKI
jgi:hypothetical protein